MLYSCQTKVLFQLEKSCPNSKVIKRAIGILTVPKLNATDLLFLAVQN